MSITLSVLYYKRQSKIHKSGKEDGILTISEGGLVVLRRDDGDFNDGSINGSNNGAVGDSYGASNGGADDLKGAAGSSGGGGASGSNNGGAGAARTKSALSQSDDDEEEEQPQYSSKKSKWNAIRKSIMSTKGKSKGSSFNGSTSNAFNNKGGGGKSGVIYSGTHREIIKRAFSDGIVEDDVLIVGPWECQVISIGCSTTSTGKPVAKQTLSKTTVVKKVVRGPLMSRKNPVVASTNIGVKRPVNNGANIGVKRPRSVSNGPNKVAKTSSAAKTPATKAQPATAPVIKKRGPLKSLKSNSLSVKSTKPMAKPSMVKTASSGNKPVNKSANSSSTSSNGASDQLPKDITIPTSIQKILRPHQKEGIEFLWGCVTGGVCSNREGQIGGEVPKGAVLADEMGLGKTLMTISTIYALHRRNRQCRTIVICPSSLVSNWSKEFDKWLGKASYPKRVAVRSGSEEGIRSLKSFVLQSCAEVLILSYELFRLHVEILKKSKKIGLLVVDEGHRLKNTSGSQTLSALNSLNVEARILITGTPIQNKLSEFYTVANFACPGILGELKEFRTLYERPMAAANKKNATREEKERGRVQSMALEEITKTFCLRRLQKDVLQSLLPPRTEVLLFCRPSGRQCEVYEDISDRANKSSVGGREENPLMLLTELRKLCTHPLLLEKESSTVEDEVALSGKMVVLDALLDSIREHHPTDKVVIVSNFTSALSVIESSILRKKNLPFVRLDGTVELSARQPMVDSFNNGSVNHSFAFLLSSKAGGCGLNLIGANRLIMVDADWNPATDQQAMARVYRQGQTKPCFIYRMFTTGTVEEVIYQRQTQKGNLAQLANDGGKTKSKSSFTPEELRDCFTLKQGCKCDTKNKLGSKWSDYSSVSSLHTQGYTDQPLLAVCEDLAETLSFVRVVDDEPVMEYDNSSADEDEASLEDASSSEEYEKLVYNEEEDSASIGESSSEEEEFDG